MIPLDFKFFSPQSNSRPDLLAHSPVQDSPQQSLPPVERWSVQRVAAWLQMIGMQRYSRAFLESGVSGEILLEADSSVLKQLGVLSKSDRDRIKDKLRELRKHVSREQRDEKRRRRRK